MCVCVCVCVHVPVYNCSKLCLVLGLRKKGECEQEKDWIVVGKVAGEWGIKNEETFLSEQSFLLKIHSKNSKCQGLCKWMKLLIIISGSNTTFRRKYFMEIQSVLGSSWFVSLIQFHRKWFAFISQIKIKQELWIIHLIKNN